jgi:hypothetical protein
MEVVEWDMLDEVGVVEVEVTVGELMEDGACVLVLDVCEAFVVELELEVDVEDLELILLVEVLPSLSDRLWEVTGLIPDEDVIEDVLKVEVTVVGVMDDVEVTVVGVMDDVEVTVVGVMDDVEVTVVGVMDDVGSRLVRLELIEAVRVVAELALLTLLDRLWIVVIEVDEEVRRVEIEAIVVNGWANEAFVLVREVSEALLDWFWDEVAVGEAEAEAVANDTVVLVLPVDLPLLDALSTPLEKIRMQARTAMPWLCDQRAEAAISIHGTLGEKVCLNKRAWFTYCSRWW